MKPSRSFLALVAAIGGLAACSSSSSTAKPASTATSTSVAAPTTTTVVQGEQKIPARTKYVVDGRSVDLVCKGRGRVPVVFQAGGRAPGKVWDPLIAALGPDVLTCVFDRPATAYDKYLSTPVGELLTPRIVEQTLADTLKQAGVGLRVILVGHSSGGLNSIVFGADHPELVAGAVLFDPTSLVDFHDFDREEWTSIGLDVDAAAQQAQAVTTWPDVPLVVLSADPKTQTAALSWTEADRTSWSAEAKRYAALSAAGTQRVVPGSAHHVYLDAPKVSLVAIQNVLNEVSSQP